METESTVTISVERFQQLVRAEQDANIFKTLIADRYKNYLNIDRADICLLHTLYFGNKEETEA